MTRAIGVNGEILTGTKLDSAILHDFANIHGSNEPDRRWIGFPSGMRVTRQRIISSASGINTGKAGSWDCVSDLIFSLRKNC